MILAFVVLCLGLTFMGYLWNRQATMVVAGLAWVAFGFWNRTTTPIWGTWDEYELLFWIGIVMAILCWAEAIVMARKPAEPLIGEKSYSDSHAEKLSDINNKVDRLTRYRRKV